MPPFGENPLFAAIDIMDIKFKNWVKEFAINEKSITFALQFRRDSSDG